MYERFTDNAWTAMRLARQQARRLNHDYVGAEHILLALAEHGTGVAVEVLRGLSVDLAAIPIAVRELVRPGLEEVESRKLPLTPCAKRVIEHACGEARNLGHSYVGTEHLLLGMLRERETIAAQVLERLEVDFSAVRNRVADLLDSPDYQRRNEAVRRRTRIATWRWNLISLLFLIGLVTIVLTVARWLR